MASKCYLIGENFASLENPETSCRNEPATDRQALLLKFFGVAAPHGATKGELADMLNSLDPTDTQIIDYTSWKSEGCPNIRQWRRRFGRKKNGGWKINLAIEFLLLVGIVMYLSHDAGEKNGLCPSPVLQGVYLALSADDGKAIGAVQTPSTEATPAPTNSLPGHSSSAPPPTLPGHSSSAPPPTIARKSWPSKAQIVKEQVFASDDGIFRLIVGTDVIVNGSDGQQLKIEFQGRPFSVPVDAVK